MGEVIERPIIFSGSMIRAILDGRKTQTRRVVKLSSGGYALKVCGGEPRYIDRRGAERPVRCPFGQPGDRMWVKEAFCQISGDAASGDSARGLKPLPKPVLYRADGDAPSLKKIWKSPLYMPRWASRLTLELTDVRVEPVQDIGRDGRNAVEVLAEGITLKEIERELKWFHQDDAPAIAFSRVWNTLYTSRGFGWHMNPWVWVVTFRRTQP